MDKFQKNSIIMVSLTTIASGINYLCQILMGRILSVEAFGVMNSLFSLILILSVPGLSYNMITAKRVSEAQGERSAAFGVARAMNQLATLSAVGIFLCLAIFSGTLSQFLHTYPIIIILTAAAIATGFSPYVLSGTFSGLRAFLVAGFLSIVAPLCKMLGVILSAGLAVADISRQTIILLSISVGNLLTVGLYFSQIFQAGEANERSLKKLSFKDMLDRNVGYVILINMLFLLLMNADILSVTIFAGSKEAGVYSAAMMFGRIIYYFTTALVTVILPYVSGEKSQGRDTKNFFVQSVIATVAIAVLCLLPINLFPDFFLQMVYGERYLAARSYLMISSVISVAFSIVNLEISYCVGINETGKLLRDILLSLSLLLLLIALWHSSVKQLLIDAAITFIVLLIKKMFDCISESTRKKGSKS